MSVMLSALFLVGSESASQERVLVLEGGTLIDSTGRQAIAGSVVLVEGTRINTVGTKGRVAYPAGARVIRLDGRTILPGLVDAHVHLRDWHLPMFLTDSSLRHRPAP